MYIPTESLSPNFKQYEITRSDLAARHGIVNIPSDQVIERAKALAINVLEPIRAHYGVPFAPQSWYRCEDLEYVLCKQAYIKWANKHVRPLDSTSWKDYLAQKSHPKGEAADIEVPGVFNDDLFAWIKGHLVYDQLIREFPVAGDPYSGWVHVSFTAERENRMQAFQIG